jgi:hypothetical protein
MQHYHGQIVPRGAIRPANSSRRAKEPVPLDLHRNPALELIVAAGLFHVEQSALLGRTSKEFHSIPMIKLFHVKQLAH